VSTNKVTVYSSLRIKSKTTPILRGTS